MLAQLEVKEINSRTFKRLLLIFKDFPVLEFFFQFKDFPGFSRPMDTLHINILREIIENHFLFPRIWASIFRCRASQDTLVARRLGLGMGLG
jgi:hypothetical protein